MSIVRFYSDGYKYLSNQNVVDFFEERTHLHLLNYASSDVTYKLAQLQSLLEQYILKRMNIETIELKQDYSHNDNEIAKIIELLCTIHPYYRYEPSKVITNTIGKYFNNLLVFWGCNKDYEFRRIDKKQYLFILSRLFKDFFKFPEKSPEYFYSKYELRVGFDKSGNIEDQNIEDPFVYGYQKKEPKIFYEEIYTQEVINEMLFWILDSSTQSLKDLPVFQRAWLYGALTELTHGSSKIKIKKELTLIPDFTNKVSEVEFLFEPFCDIGRINEKCIDGSTKLSKALAAVAEYAKRISSSVLYEEYEIDNLYQLLYLEILLMIQDDIKIKKCKRCGMYFVVDDNKKAYCDRKIDGKICSRVGSRQTFQKKLDNDPALEFYNRTYKTYHRRVKNGIMTQSEFSEWADDAKEKRNKVRDGEIDLETFQESIKVPLPSKKIEQK